MKHVGLDSQGWSEIVGWLDGEEALDASAREHGAFFRAREIKRASGVLRLSLMYGPGGYSLRTLAAMASAMGLADMSDVAVLGRIRNAANWLQFLCAEQLRRAAQACGIEQAGRAIRIVDATRLEGPGDRVWRMHLCYDAGHARIVDASITTTREGERLDRLLVTPGELRLGDRGFPQPDGIKNTLAAGGDVLVRLTWKSLHLTLAHGAAIDWRQLFKRVDDEGSLDLPVLLHKAHSKFEPIAMRLVIVEKPAGAAAQARVKARRASTKNGRKTDPRTLAAANYTIYLTSLSRDEFTVNEVAALYRLRWQIELAIKRLKSLLHIDRLPAKDPDLARTWLYAHLLLALMIEARIARTGSISPSAPRFATALDLENHDPHRTRALKRRLAAA